MMREGLRGPARFFATHPVALVASLLGAKLAAVVFGFRALRASGWRRWAWLALFVFQAAQVVGIWRMRPRKRVQAREDSGH